MNEVRLAIWGKKATGRWQAPLPTHAQRQGHGSKTAARQSYSGAVAERFSRIGTCKFQDLGWLQVLGENADGKLVVKPLDDQEERYELWPQEFQDDIFLTSMWPSEKLYDDEVRGGRGDRTPMPGQTFAVYKTAPSAS